MSTRRWIKFWPQDWQRDPALRVCSMASRGLWMEALCIMHDAEPCGHLVMNGKPVTSKQLAAIVGAPEKEVVRLLAELEDAGVFSRTDAGVVYSRRMVRDAAASEDGKRHIGKRWTKKDGGDNPGAPPNSPPNRSNGKTLIGEPVGDLIHQEAEAEAEAPPNPPGGDGGGRLVWEGVQIDKWSADHRGKLRPTIAGWHIDIIGDKVLEAAGLPLNATLAGGFRPLAGWLREGFEGDEIVAAIRAAAPGMDGRTASLARFDGVVRAACRRRGAA